MKKIEDIVCDKIFGLVNYVISYKIKPDINIENVTELTEKEIRRLKRIGIEGVILDLDETLRKKMYEIPACNQKWLDMVKSNLKVIIVSNGMDKDMEKFFKLKGIDYIGFAHKPFKKNFQKACNLMRIDPRNVLVIGDDLFSDIYGGKRNDMMTALVKGKILEEENQL